MSTTQWEAVLTMPVDEDRDHIQGLVDALREVGRGDHDDVGVLLDEGVHLLLEDAGARHLIARCSDERAVDPLPAAQQHPAAAPE